MIGRPRSKLVRRFLDGFCGPAVDRKKASGLRRPLRMEPLEDRRLLSASLGDLANITPVALPAVKYGDMVIHDADGQMFGVDPNTLSPVLLGQFVYDRVGVVMEDIALIPWEDGSVANTPYGFFGVAWQPDNNPITPKDHTSLLYYITVEPNQPTVTTQFVTEIWADSNPDGKPVRLNALEFDNRGRLHAAGHYDYNPWLEPDVTNFEDWTFTIDWNVGLATRQEQLLIGSVDYYSSGDITFAYSPSYPDGHLYLTTYTPTLAGVAATLLKDSAPATPGSIEAKTFGKLFYPDFAGFVIDPPQNWPAFRQHTDSLTGYYGVYSIALGGAAPTLRGWLGDNLYLDDIFGAAVIWSSFIPGTISGMKFSDLDRDGVHDASEPGLAGWTIFLDEDDDGQLDDGEASTVTDANGNYSFTNVVPDTYTIREVLQDNWTQTSPVDDHYVVEMLYTQDVAGKDFGNASAPGKIMGTKWSDLDADGIFDDGEPGLPGWTIYIDEDDDGHLDAGEITVTTDANGDYTFSDLNGGTYVIREVLQSGWKQTAPSGGSYEVTLEAGDEVDDRDFGNVELGSISGSKFSDLNANTVRDAGEPWLAGWTIFIDANADGFLDPEEETNSTETDANGNYTLADVEPGTHRVAEVLKTGWMQTTPADGFHLVTMTVGEDVAGRDFGNTELGSISGVKWNDVNENEIRDDGEPLLSGWTVYVDANDNETLDTVEKSAITDTDGNYTIAGLVPGTHRVREVLKDDWRMTSPAEGFHEVTLTAGQDVAGRDFGNTVPRSISGKKFNDLDGDGVFDNGEPGLSDWTIFIDEDGDKILDANETSTPTDAEGDYSFADLEPGTYTICEVNPGWPQTVPAGGCHTVTLGSGDNATGKNFGNQVLAPLGRVDFKELSAQEPENGQLWYSFEAFRGAVVTSALAAGHATDDTRLTLYHYDQAGNLVTLSSGNPRVDFLAGVGGQDYFLRVEGLTSNTDLVVANLVRVSQDGYTVDVFGTDQHDEFEFVAHAPTAQTGVMVHELSIKGVPYEFPLPLIPNAPEFSVTFDGAAGADRAKLNGFSGTDEAELHPTSGAMQGID